MTEDVEEERGGVVRYAALFPLALILFGIVTSVPWLFNTLGVCLYVAILRECGRHVIPWPWARRLMRLGKSMHDAAGRTPPPVSERGSDAKYLIREYRPGHWAVTPNPNWKDPA